MVKLIDFLFWKSTSITNKINNGSVPFKCPGKTHQHAQHQALTHT